MLCAECHGEFPAKRAGQQFCCRTCANRFHGKAIEREAAVSVWSCGGGVESTAIAVLVAEGVLPKPDIAVFVDCGWERKRTMSYLQDVLRPRLAAVGVRLQRVQTIEFGENELIDRRGYVAIPAYRRTADGKVTKLRTRCSGPWKARTAKRWLRRQGVVRCENWVGFAADESRRAKQSPNRWIRHRWPLIELGMDREDCLYAIGKAGWPKPPRSNCVMCPQHSDSEWLRMANDEPGEFKRASEIEDLVLRRCPGTFLHRSCRALAEWAATAMS